MKTLEFQGKIMEKRRETMVSTFVHVEISCMSSQKKTSTCATCESRPFCVVLPNQWRFFWSIPMDHVVSYHSVAKVDKNPLVI